MLKKILLFDIFAILAIIIVKIFILPGVPWMLIVILSSPVIIVGITLLIFFREG